MQSPTSTGYFSKSAGSFVTNCQFSPIIGLKNDMDKVRTYQLSAHQQLQFKVRT